jgi:hypothetical protein
MIVCDSCGGRYDPGTESQYCPHGAAGLKPGTVGTPAWDDRQHADGAERELRARLKKDFSRVMPDCEFKVWTDRSELYGPSGAYTGIGYRLCFSVLPAHYDKLKNFILDQPNEYQGLELWYLPWDERPQC